MLLSQLLRRFPLLTRHSVISCLPSPPVATVGHHRECEVQGGVDREPPRTMHSPPSGEPIVRGSMLGEQVQISPGHLEFSAPPSGSAQRQVTFDSA